MIRVGDDGRLEGDGKRKREEWLRCIVGQRREAAAKRGRKARAGEASTVRVEDTRAAMSSTRTTTLSNLEDFSNEEGQSEFPFPFWFPTIIMSSLPTSAHARHSLQASIYDPTGAKAARAELTRLREGKTDFDVLKDEYRCGLLFFWDSSYWLRFPSWLDDVLFTDGWYWLDRFIREEQGLEPDEAEGPSSSSSMAA
jgi:hypothetical protein